MICGWVGGCPREGGGGGDEETDTAMNHVPPANIWAVWVVGAADEGGGVAVQDTLAIWEDRLPPLPVPLRHLLRSAWTTLHEQWT